MKTQTLSRIIIASGVIGMALAGAGCARNPAAKAAQFLKNGRSFMEKKDYSRAILQFRNAVQLQPQDAEPYYQLGLAYLAKPDVQQATACFRKTLQVAPKHPGATLKLAGLMAATPVRANVVRAEQMAGELVAAAPGNLEALDTLAAAQVRLGKIDDAEQHLMEALRRAPAHLEASAGLARLKLLRKDVPGAEQALRDAVAQNSKATEPLVMLGEFYQAMKRPDAEQTFQRALHLDAANGPALYDLGALLMSTDRRPEADDVYRRLSALDDKRYRPIHAQYLYSAGRIPEAVAEFEKLAAAAPNDREARSRLIAAYVSVERVADAARLLDAALQKNPKDVEARLERSRILVRQGRYNDAQMDLNEALHFRPDSAEIHYALSKVHEARGAQPNRKQELNEVVRLQPAMLQARLELAQLLTASGEARSAVELLNQAPAQQRNTPALVLDRNWALITTGHLAEARAALDKLLAGVRAASATPGAATPGAATPGAASPIPGAALQDAVLRFRSKDYAGARAAAEDVLKTEPVNVAAMALLLDSQAASGHLDKGIERVKAQARQQPAAAAVQQFLGQVLVASRADPKLAAADLALAQLDIAENRLDDARRRLTAMPAPGAQAFVLLGNLEERAQNHAQAIAAYRRVLELDPRNAPALNNLAFLLSESAGGTDEALKYAEQAKELAPRDAAVDDTLGWTYFHKGIYATAVKHLESANARESTARRQYHLAMAYWKTGDQKRSRDSLKAALRMDPTLPESAAAVRLMGPQ